MRAMLQLRTSIWEARMWLPHNIQSQAELFNWDICLPRLAQAFLALMLNLQQTIQILILNLGLQKTLAHGQRPRVPRSRLTYSSIRPPASRKHTPLPVADLP